LNPDILRFGIDYSVTTATIWGSTKPRRVCEGSRDRLAHIQLPILPLTQYPFAPRFTHVKTDGSGVLFQEYNKAKLV
jgi:hypothetical protein